MNVQMTRRPLIAAGTALGIGMGGFVDGIVLHQLMQVHNMLSAKYPTRGIEADRLRTSVRPSIFPDIACKGSQKPPSRRTSSQKSETRS